MDFFFSLKKLILQY